MAACMVGGLLSVVLMSLLVYPAVFAFWKAHTIPAERDE